MIIIYIFMTILTTAVRKRRYQEDRHNNQANYVHDKYGNISDKNYCKTCDVFISPSQYRQDQSLTKLGKFDDDSIDLFTYLDYSESPKLLRKDLVIHDRLYKDFMYGSPITESFNSNTLLQNKKSNEKVITEYDSSISDESQNIYSVSNFEEVTDLQNNNVEKEPKKSLTRTNLNKLETKEKNAKNEITEIPPLITDKKSFKDNKTSCLTNIIAFFKEEQIHEVEKKNLNLCLLENNTNSTKKLNSTEETIPTNSSLRFNDLSELCHVNMNEKFAVLKSYIETYIGKFISGCYNFGYMIKVESIEEACIIFDKNKFDQVSYSSIFNILHAEDLLNELKTMHSAFDKKSKFDKKTCDKFINDIDKKIFNVFTSMDIRFKLNNLTNTQKNIFFYFETIKLYKYAAEFPELLTLVGLYKDKTFRSVLFTIYLINLFIENIGDVKDNKIFISCMIYKAFACYHGLNKFDIFLIPYYELECDKTRLNLHYFFWEFNSKKRSDIKRKKFVENQQSCSDLIHLKCVFLIFIYQHSICIRYFNISHENLKAFSEYIDRVMMSRDCFICLFDEFLLYMKKLNLASSI